MPSFTPSQESYARLRALPTAPPGKTYVLATLAYDSAGTVLTTPEDLLAWVHEFVETPALQLDPELAGSPLAVALVTGLAVVGPLPVADAASPVGVLMMRVSLFRQAARLVDDDDDDEPPPAPAGGWN